MRVFVFILGVLSYAMAFTQNVGISNTAITPDVSAGMEVRYTNKGVLIPRVALTSVTDAATIATPATSLLVYCTGTGGLAPAGYYYNSGTAAAPNWVKMATGTSLDDAWKLLGNAGTNPATNFLGTTDAQDLSFRTNNTNRMRILSGGNVGIGTTAPTERLVVNGNVYSSTGDFYASGSNGVINCGGGIMNPNVNVISDGIVNLDLADGDEDLYINDDLEVDGDVRIEGGIDDGASFGTDGQFLATYGSNIIWADPKCGEYTSDFESNFGIWSNMDGDDADWTRYTGSTTSSGTGPTSANEGAYYIYCETSSPRAAGDVFMIQTSARACDNPSISFDYHMYFNAVADGTLNLEVSTDNGSTWTSVWSMTGDQGNTWHNDQVVSLAAYANSFIDVRFSFTIGSAGTAYQYDCALDDVTLSDINSVYPVSGGSSGDGWELLGNAGTTTGTNFLGTTDNTELDFRTNNVIRLRMTTKGQLETMNTGHSVFLGEMAGESDDLTDNYNVAIGYESMFDNTTGSVNVCIGQRALYNNISGTNNVAVGYWSCQGAGSASNNVGVGRYSLYQNQGSSNVGVGYAAGAGVSGPTYTYCTYLGYDADFGVTGTYTNAMALGNGATVTASNRVRVGNTSITRIGGQVGWTTISDGRVKKNVSEDVSGIDFIMKLRPVTYTLDKNTQDEILNSPDATVRPDKYEIEKTRFSGFIAQEVEIAANEVGYNFSGVKTPAHDNDLYGLTYSDFVVPLVKATQEQQSIIEDQNKRIENLETEIENLKLLIENLSSQE